MPFEDEFKSVCVCCKDNLETNNKDNSCCEFCSKIHPKMVEILEKPKKDESSADYRIRFLLFEKTKNLSELYRLQAPEFVLSQGFYLLICYYELSEYYLCDYHHEEIKKVDIVEALNDILKCYYENRENDLTLCFEKFKAHVFESKYCSTVKENLQTMNKKSYYTVHNFCLDCGEQIEEHMKYNYCQACTMLSQAIGDDFEDLN